MNLRKHIRTKIFAYKSRQAGKRKAQWKKRLEKFLDQPLVDIHRTLSEGMVHPRMYFLLEQVRERLFALGHFDNQNESSLAGLAMDSSRRKVFFDLVSGLPDDDRLPSEGKLAIQAGWQLQNGCLVSAEKTMSHIIASVHQRSGLQSLADKLEDYRQKIQCWNMSASEVTKRLSEELYQQILAEEPERQKEIAYRQRTEEILRSGNIRSWQAVKGDRKTLPVGSLNEQTILGRDKVFLLTIEGEDGSKIQAYAKSSDTENYFREHIAPEREAVQEWLAAFEAMAMGSKTFSPTVVRHHSLFGDLSVVKAIIYRDDEGKWHRPIRAKNVPEWEIILSDENREEIALLQLLRREADGGQPNHLLVPTGTDRYFAMQIDAGLSQPFKEDGVFIQSCLLAASADRDISEATLAKLNVYERRLDLIANAMRELLPTGVKPGILYRREIINQLLTEKKFRSYESYDGDWGLRDKGVFQERYGGK